MTTIVWMYWCCILDCNKYWTLLVTKKGSSLFYFNNIPLVIAKIIEQMNTYPMDLLLSCSCDGRLVSDNTGEESAKLLCVVHDRGPLVGRVIPKKFNKYMSLLRSPRTEVFQLVKVYSVDGLKMGDHSVVTLGRWTPQWLLRTLEHRTLGVGTVILMRWSWNIRMLGGDTRKRVSEHILLIIITSWNVYVWNLTQYLY